MVFLFNPKHINHDPKDFYDSLHGRYYDEEISKFRGFLDKASIDFSRYDAPAGIREDTHHFAAIHPYLYDPNLRTILAFPKSSFPTIEYCRVSILKHRKLAFIKKGKNTGEHFFEVLDYAPLDPVDLPPEKPEISGNSVAGFIEEMLFPDDTFNTSDKEHLMPFVLCAMGAPILFEEHRAGGIGVNPIVASKDETYITGTLRQCDEIFGRIAALTSSVDNLIGYSHALPKKIKIRTGIHFDLNPIVCENIFDLKFGKSLSELNERYRGFDKFIQDRPIGFYREHETSFIAPSAGLIGTPVKILLKKADTTVVIPENMLKQSILKVPVPQKFHEALRYLRYILPGFADSAEEDRFTQKIMNKLEKLQLKRAYGNGPPIMDANHYGKIAAVKQLARALARRAERSVILETDINLALNNLELNSDEVAKWYYDSIGNSKTDGKPNYTKAEKIILRIVEKHQEDSEFGCLCTLAKAEYLASGGTNEEFEKSCDKLIDIDKPSLFTPKRGFIKRIT